jgi:transposase InsO family protein
LALVEVSVVEQRYRAVLEVRAGARVTEVAARFGVSRQSVHAWLRRYEEGGLGGLADRSRRPESCPHQTPAEVEAAVCGLRREHPKWGPVRIAHELGRSGVVPVPSRMSVHRVLVRHGLIEPGTRRRPKDSHVRWERDEPMALWQLDIVGGAFLAGGTEAKIVTGVDDHSRYCVIACVVARATGRAVCLAFAAALRAYGVPDEVLTDNGKQFTDRFGKGGEVLFDRICRDNGITHRLTQPRSPTTTGKIERFHGSLRREFLDDAVPFTDLAAAQAALDGWMREYNTRRPHQAIGMAALADRFSTAGARADEQLLPLRLPSAIALVPAPALPADPAPPADDHGRPVRDGPPRLYDGGPVEFERVVPASGNMQVAGKQFWPGPFRGHSHVLGQHRRHPPDHRRGQGQDRPLAPVDGRPGPARRRRRQDRGSPAAAARRARNGDRGRPDRQQGRRGPPRRALPPGRGDPRRPPRQHPDRGGHDDDLRPRHPGAAAHPAQPADLGPGPPAARRPPGRAASAALHGAGHRPAQGEQHRRDHGRRAEDRPRPHPHREVVTVHVAAEVITIDLHGEDARTVRQTTTQAVRSIKAHRPRQRQSGTA